MTAVVAATRFGPMIVPPFDEYLSQALIRRGEYAPAEFATWRPYIPEGGTVFDVGANIGAHTFAFAQAVGNRGRVVAFEPQRPLAYMVAGSAALLGVERVVDVRNIGLGEKADVLPMPPIDYGMQANFGGIGLREASDAVKEAGRAYSVLVQPLDTAVADVDINERLDFIKVDVEGMEVPVLRGAQATVSYFRPVICAEADREKSVPALLGWFKLHGYRAWWHRPPLGDLWPNVVSINLLGLPREKELPEPQGDVEVAIA